MINLFGCGLRRGCLFSLLLFSWAGCDPGEELAAQESRLDEEQAERMAELDRIEARLVESAGRTRLWRDLGDRHGRVSEIACENAELHAQAMDRHRSRQAAKPAREDRLAQMSGPGEGETPDVSNN